MNKSAIIQAAMKRVSLLAPSAVTDSLDRDVATFEQLLGEEGEELSLRHEWQTLRREHTFDMTGATYNDLPTDFQRFVPDTFWDTTDNERVYGPLTPEQWMSYRHGNITTSVLNYFRVQNDRIYFVNDEAHNYAYEYIKKFWCISSDSVDELYSATTDASTFYLDAEALTLGVTWRFLQARGLEYGEAFAKYEARVQNLWAHEGARQKLRLIGPKTMSPKPHVPDGNWPL